MQLKEAVAQRYSVKKLFLEISQNSQENTCARVSFLIAALGLQQSHTSTLTHIAKTHQHSHIIDLVLLRLSYN